jgi:hypothetical protein
MYLIGAIAVKAAAYLLPLLPAIVSKATGLATGLPS